MLKLMEPYAAVGKGRRMFTLVGYPQKTSLYSNRAVSNKYEFACLTKQA